MANDTLDADIQAIKDAGGNDNDVMNYLKQNNVSFSEDGSISEESKTKTQDEKISQRPSAIKDLINNPTTMKHPLGALLRTLGGAAELYQGVPASVAMDLQAGKPQDILSNLTKVATGQRPAQYGDVFQGAGIPKPLAATAGLYTDIVLAPGGAESLVGLKNLGVLTKNAIKEIPSGVKKVLNWENSIQQANKAKGALDALERNYGSAYQVALDPVKSIPVDVDFGLMPKKVLDVLKNEKDTYGVLFNANGSLVNTLENVNKIKTAADEMLTPAMRMEGKTTEINQIKQFAGHIGKQMRIAANKAGKPIDEAMDAYGSFKDKYNQIAYNLKDKIKDASANKLRAQFTLKAEPEIKQAWKDLSKESPELKSIMDSRKNRELLKRLLIAVPTGAAAIEGTKKLVTGHL